MAVEILHGWDQSSGFSKFIAASRARRGSLQNGRKAALSVLGVPVVLVTVPAAIIVFGFLGAFFPDSQFIVSNAIRVLVFLTPSSVCTSGIQAAFCQFNPFTYYLQIVRVPC